MQDTKQTNGSVKQNISLKGVYKFTLAHIETDEQRELDARIKTLQAEAAKAFEAGNFIRANDLQQMSLPLVRKLNSICRTEVTTKENLIPDVARTAIANWLTNASPSPASIRLNYTALGTGTNTPANADTQLQTETYRKAIASESNTNNVVYATAFYTTTETTGTYREAGIFMNASGTANSGTLFSRIAINITKNSTTTLTIDYTVTIS